MRIPILVRQYLYIKMAPGGRLNKKDGLILPGMAIPMLKIRRPNGRLIFNMEITIRR